MDNNIDNIKEEQRQLAIKLDALIERGKQRLEYLEESRDE